MYSLSRGRPPVYDRAALELSDEDKAEKQELLALASGAEVAVISGISGDGLQTLMAVLFGVIGRQTESTQPKRAFAP